MKNTFSRTKSVLILALFLVAAILSVMFMGKVEINYNISNYLDDSTETKISLDIIEKEFGMNTGVQVMIDDIDIETANGVASSLAAISCSSSSSRLPDATF